MNAIHIAAVISAIFVIWFTLRAWSDDEATGGRQSRRQAIIEVWIGIIIGATINCIMNLILLPMVGARVSIAENLSLTCAYTGVSVFRSYIIRRYFDDRIHSLAARAAERLS